MRAGTALAVLTAGTALAAAQGYGPPAGPGPAGPPPGAPPSPAAPAPVAGPAVEEDAAPPTMALTLAGGVAWRIGPAGRDVPPRVGFSVRPSFAWQYHQTELVSLGLEVGFSFDRFARGITVVPEGQPPTEGFSSVRNVSHYDFSGLQTARLLFGRLTPWVGGGVGVGLGYFHTLEPAFRPGDARTVRPLLRGAVGLDYRLGPSLAVGLRADGAYMLWRPGFTLTTGQRLSVFGDRLSVALGLSQGF